METVTIANAKTRLSELVERAAAGETVFITRRGRPVARLVLAETPRIDVPALRAVTGAMPRQSESAGEFVRRMRDEGRY